MARALGFEPRLTGSEPVGLPLHQTRMAQDQGFEPWPAVLETAVLPLHQSCKDQDQLCDCAAAIIVDVGLLVRAAGFEPAFFWVRARRGQPNSPTPCLGLGLVGLFALRLIIGTSSVFDVVGVRMTPRSFPSASPRSYPTEIGDRSKAVLLRGDVDGPLGSRR